MSDVFKDSNKTWADYATPAGEGMRDAPATPAVDELLGDNVAFLDAAQAHLNDMRKAHAEGRRITGALVSTIAASSDSDTGSLGLIHNPMSNLDLEVLGDAITARLLGMDIKEFVEGGGLMGALGGLLNTDAPWDEDWGPDYTPFSGDDN